MDGSDSSKDSASALDIRTWAVLWDRGKHDPALGFFRTRDSDRLLEEVQESQDSLRDGHRGPFKYAPGSCAWVLTFTLRAPILQGL